MSSTSIGRIIVFICMAVFTGTAAAQAWNAAQQEVWKVEEQQWKMSAAKDDSWIEKMVHPSLSYWDNDRPAPQDKASLIRWNRYNSSQGAILEQELYPIAIVITGNIAVVQYRYSTARENYKKERETAHGRYTDVLLKEGGRWQFIAWSGGDDPKK